MTRLSAAALFASIIAGTSALGAWVQRPDHETTTQILQSRQYTSIETDSYYFDDKNMSCTLKTGANRPTAFNAVAASGEKVTGLVCYDNHKNATIVWPRNPTVSEFKTP